MSRLSVLCTISRTLDRFDLLWLDDPWTYWEAKLYLYCSNQATPEMTKQQQFSKPSTRHKEGLALEIDTKQTAAFSILQLQKSYIYVPLRFSYHHKTKNYPIWHKMKLLDYHVVFISSFNDLKNEKNKASSPQRNLPECSVTLVILQQTRMSVMRSLPRDHARRSVHLEPAGWQVGVEGGVRNDIYCFFGGGGRKGLIFGLGERNLEFCNIVTTIVITYFAKKA